MCLVTSPRQSSGENISGTANRIPVSKQLSIVRKILRFKKIGILFNPREKNAMLMRKELYVASKKFQFEVVDLRSAPVGKMLESNLKMLIEDPRIVDVVYLPLDSFLITKAKEIGKALIKAKIPSIGAQKKFIKNGVLLGVIPNYYRLG